MAGAKPPLEKGTQDAEFLVVLNSASMDQRLVKENVWPLQIIKGMRHVKKNRCEPCISHLQYFYRHAVFTPFLHQQKIIKQQLISCHLIFFIL